MAASDMLDAALPSAVGHRHWDLRHTGERPLTINRLVNMHRMAWAAHTAATRKLWWALAREAHLPHLHRARITVLPLHADRRSPQDAAACAPAAKAAIDGIIDAGVLPDDGPAHLLAVTFLQPLICGDNGMHLRIEEAT